MPLGLDFILNLRPVKFTWNMRDGGKVGIPDMGFIAQEVAQTEDQFAVAEWLKLVSRDNPEKLELGSGRLIPVAVRAIQELADLVNSLTDRVATLEEKIRQLGG